MKETSTRTRRYEIVEATTDLFLENGFAGTSMSAVAKACGITKASLYHHFPGKDDLFAACITKGYASALDDLATLVERSDLAPNEKLGIAIDRLYDRTIASPVGRMSPLIAEVSRAFPNVARAFHSEYIDPQRKLIGQILDQGTETGAFREIDRELFFHVLFGPIVTLSLSRQMFASFEDLDDHFPVDALRQGHKDLILNWMLV
jgi:AcrR family transcriptional regulator